MTTFSESFTTNVIGSYTFDAGAGTMDVDTVAGQLRPLSLALKRGYRNNWTLQEDIRNIWKFTLSSTLAGRFGSVAKRQASDTYIQALVDVAEQKLQLSYFMAGDFNYLAQDILTGAFASGGSYWIDLQIDDDVARASLWNANPLAGGTTEANRIASSAGISIPLPTRNTFGKYAIGGVGFSFEPASTSARFDDHVAIDSPNPQNPHPVGGVSYALPAPYRDRSSWPGGGWIPGDPNSRFNTPIPNNARVHPRSDEIVANLIAMSPPATPGPDHIGFGRSGNGTSFEIPLYWASESDPLYTLTVEPTYFDPITEWPYHNHQIYIPEAARPANGGDLHLSVIQPDGVQWDFYKVQNKDDVNHTMLSRIGGPTQDTVYGSIWMRHESIASGTLATVGAIRPEEWAGSINHALHVVTACTGTGFNHPARKLALACSDPRNLTDSSMVDKPLTGMQFRLNYTNAEIAALPSAWQRSIATALKNYGMIVTDTKTIGWAFRKTDAHSYISFGYDDPWVTIGRTMLNAQTPNVTIHTDGIYLAKVRENIDWTKLQVVDTGRNQAYPRGDRVAQPALGNGMLWPRRR